MAKAWNGEKGNLKSMLKTSLSTEGRAKLKETTVGSLGYMGILQGFNKVYIDLL